MNEQDDLTDSGNLAADIFDLENEGSNLNWDEMEEDDTDDLEDIYSTLVGFRL